VRKAAQNSAVSSLQINEKNCQRKEKTEAQGFLVTFWPPKSDKDKWLEFGHMSPER
jgi:hypothetical protein